MILYNLRLAAKSLKRNPILSVLIVVGIALGVGLSTWTLTLGHVLGRDPLPGKSDRLFYVRLDSWDPAAPHPDSAGVPTQITYRDLRGLMESDLPERQTGSFKSRFYVYPASPDVRPFQEMVRLVFADFFPMFELPFAYGRGWDAAADAGPEAVVVLSSEINDRLFGGRDSVGETVRLGERDFTVVGVLAPWHPRVKFYDLTQNPMQPPEQIYLPFNWTEPMEIASSGNRDGWTRTEGETFSERLWSSESVFIQMWVELADAEAVAAYRSFLDAYAGEQKRLGRFQRPLDNRLTALPEWMAERNVVPPELKALTAISVLFLVVCALNLIGLFLGKFLARAPVVGVRRALGASRGAIFLQHVLEAELVGLIGGALGLLLAVGGLALLNRVLSEVLEVDHAFGLDATMVAVAAGLSLVAGLIAGLYPAWRICKIPPAQHLKTQ